MSSVVDTVAEHLEASGLTSGWPVFRGYEPDDPDHAVTVLEFPGPPPDTTFLADYPSFQVRVRGLRSEYVAARDKAQDLHDAVHAQPVAGTSVSPNEALVYVVAEQQPFLVARDARERVVFAFNCRSMRSR